ncbi:MAG: hypothetical protein ACQPRH_00955 [Solitalea-like symbiont of Tyrophagus putrescentiae]
MFCYINIYSGADAVHKNSKGQITLPQPHFFCIFALSLPVDLKSVKDLSDNPDQKQSNSILGLIDQKTNSDMQKVLSEIKTILVRWTVE